MPKKVLLVDDEPELLEAMAERMQLRGMDVSTTTSPWDALEIIEGGDFDAIVLDLVMPEMDGFDALRAIKKTNPDLQVILLSGYATVEIEEKARKLGAVDLMEKPPDLEDLCHKIRRRKAHKKASGKNP